MKIDTLIFSGGGASGLSYLGIYKAMIEDDFFEKHNINEIITTSIGILMSFIILIRINYNILYNIATKYNFEKFIDIDNVNIDNILLEHGLFETEGIENIFRVLIKNVMKKDDINLRELYEISKIILRVKVFNTTKGETEYISHEEHPNISIITLAKMTTAVPLLFKPVKYNDCLYVDGGIKGSFPLEICKSDNYLGIYMNGGMLNFIDNSLINYILSLMIYEKYKNINEDRVIYIKTDMGFSLDINTECIDKLIELSYNSYFNLFNK